MEQTEKILSKYAKHIDKYYSDLINPKLGFLRTVWRAKTTIKEVNKIGPAVKAVTDIDSRDLNQLAAFARNSNLVDIAESFEKSAKLGKQTDAVTENVTTPDTWYNIIPRAYTELKAIKTLG